MTEPDHSDFHANSAIGIITYDFFHLKTEQVVHRLLRQNLRKIKIIAFPFKERAERSVLIPHRPNQFDAIRTEDLAKANGLGFQRYDGKLPLVDCDLYLVTGAGILPPEIVRDRQILNVHPGIIPSARGLDAFKWSIYDGVELGVTLHKIDENVDQGQIVSIVKTPIYEEDNLLTLSRRHYELEIEVLSNFSRYLSNSSFENYPLREARRRMPMDVEAQMVRRFDEYKEKFAKRSVIKNDRFRPYLVERG